MVEIIQNSGMIVGAVILVVLAGYGVMNFLELPRASQIEKVKKWLLQAIIRAEKELGAETGQVKLSVVYDAFVTKFPTTARIISFDTFSQYVDEVLDEMRELLVGNQGVQEYINK